MLTLLSLSLFSSPAMAELNPPDATISNGIVADIPPEGFDSIVAIIPDLIPLDIPVDDQYFEDGLGLGCWADVWFSITNLKIDASVADAQIIPQDGYLDFSVTLSVAINDALDPFGMDYELVCIEYNCDAYVDPFEVVVASKIYLNVIDLDGDGVNDLDVYFDNFGFDYSDFDGQDINVENCALGTFEDVLNIFGWSVFDLLIGAVGPGLESGIQDALPEIEAALEDAFSQATINQTVDLGGAPLDLAIAPADIIIKPEGLRLIMDASATTPEAAECIAIFDPLGSEATSSTLMPIGYLPAGITEASLAATIDDDFVNQALYSVWRSGLLCFTVDESLFALDTSMLDLLTGGAFADLFPDPQPMIIKTEPKNPLTLNVETPADLAVDVKDLGLGFYAEVDGRRTRLLNVDLTTDVRVDIPFDDTTGALAVNIDLDTDRVVPIVSYNEFRPDASAEIESSFAGQLDTILGFIDIESMLGDLSFTLPSMNGFGLTSLDFTPTGENSEDLGAFVSLGPVPYESAGCDEEGGCGGSGGCEGSGGCSTNGRPNSRLALLNFVLLFVWLRRRTS